MSKTKHTPGPWAQAGTRPDAPCYVVTTGEDGTAVAICPQLDDETHLTNANLIAAAPDLLAACEVALECADMSGAVRAMLTDAIKKARGGA